MAECVRRRPRAPPAHGRSDSPAACGCRPSADGAARSCLAPPAIRAGATPHSPACACARPAALPPTQTVLSLTSARSPHHAHAQQEISQGPQEGLRRREEEGQAQVEGDVLHLHPQGSVGVGCVRELLCSVPRQRDTNLTAPPPTPTVMKQVHPDHTMSSKAMSCMNSLVLDLFERLGSAAGNCVRRCLGGRLVKVGVACVRACVRVCVLACAHIRPPACRDLGCSATLRAAGLLHKAPG